MSIERVEMFTVICDNCGEDFKQESTDENLAQENALKADWIKNRDDHFCPDCWSYDGNDNLIIKHKDS